MAAIRSGVTPSCLMRCFLRQSGGSKSGNHTYLEGWNQRFLQRSRLHMAVDCTSSTTRAMLSRRHSGRFLLVSAVSVRHNSSQIPTETVPTIADQATHVTPSTPDVLQGANAAPPTVEVLQGANAAPPTLEVLQGADVAPSTLEVLQGADVVPSALEVLQGAGAELSLAELGLGRATPVGLVQNMLEFIHVDIGTPWWGAIVIGTVLARLLVFPMIVKGQREAAKLNNVMPEITKFTTRMSEAKQSGNMFEFSKASHEMSVFQKKHDVHPLRGFLVPLVQMPVFISFFIALRKMSYLPVPSMQTGGALWFMDLTAADPFYLLPLATTATMFFVIELGAETGVDNPNLKTMKTVFRIMPFVILPLTINFPTAVFTYWLTSNCISLGQVALLKHPLVRQKLGIPERLKHPTSAMPQEGIIESMKKGWKNAQVAQQLQERERRIKNHLDIASRGPLRQTFTHNPLQQGATPPPISAASAKSAKAGAQPTSDKKRPWEETIG